MKLRSSVAAVCIALAALAATISACGARTGLDAPPPAPPPPQCYADADCPGSDDLCNAVVCRLFSAEADAGADVKKMPGGVCVNLTPINCDDNDPCTNDSCDSFSGACIYAQAAHDLDGDGYKGPRPGTIPGAPGSCGDDCDDTNPLIHPGAKDECGVDNDCDGDADIGVTYVSVQAEPTRIDGDIAPAEPGGLAWSGTSYAAIYSGGSTHFDMYRNMRTAAGDVIAPGETRVTEVNADSAGGPIVWIGDRYGVAWQDRRDGDYEIYFTLLKEDGSKAIPDTRLTFAAGFSIGVSLTFNGDEFLAVWQDERNGAFDIYAQRIGRDGAPIGDNIALTTQNGIPNESPTIVTGLTGVGVVWTTGEVGNHAIVFQAFGQDLKPLPATPAPVNLTDGTTEAVYPTMAYNKGKNNGPGSYVVAWFDRSATPKAIYGTLLGDDGTLGKPSPVALSNPGPFRSRYPSLRPFGDRVLIVYSDDRDQNGGYELYSRMVSSTLDPVTPELRITNAPKDSIYPVTTFGPKGDVGVLFRDDRIGGEHHVFFTRLVCVLPP